MHCLKSLCEVTAKHVFYNLEESYLHKYEEFVNLQFSIVLKTVKPQQGIQAALWEHWKAQLLHHLLLSGALNEHIAKPT